MPQSRYFSTAALIVYSGLTFQNPGVYMKIRKTGEKVRFDVRVDNGMNTISGLIKGVTKAAPAGKQRSERSFYCFVRVVLMEE